METNQVIAVLILRLILGDKANVGYAACFSTIDNSDFVASSSSGMGYFVFR